MRLLGVLLLCSLAVQSAFATETNLTLTVDGVTYSNVTFGTLTPSSVTIFYRTGIARIPLEKLPPELQKQFGYDPQKAAAETLRIQEAASAATIAANTPEAKAAKAAADLDGLQKQRVELVKHLADARDSLERAKVALANVPPDRVEQLYRTVVDPDGGRYDAQMKVSGPSHSYQEKAGTRTIPNPDRPKRKNAVSFYQKQVSEGEAALAELDNQIRRFPPVGASDYRHENPTATTPNPLFAAPPPAIPIRPPPVGVSTVDTASKDTSSAAIAFKLVKAVWGADSTWVDVTAHVQSLIAAGTTSINASTIIFGDPIFGQVKTLKITYGLRGKQVTESIREGESYNVPTPDAPIRPR